MYKSKIVPYFFILPFLVLIFTFLLFPFFKNIFQSFFEMKNILSPIGDFVGFENYIRLFEDSFFQYSLRNTGILIILVVVFQVGIALLLALLVSLINKFATFFKVSYFMPIVISATAIGLMFNLFYTKDESGMLNQIIGIFGHDPIHWKNSDFLPGLYICLTLPVVWQYIGFYFVIFVAALANISDEILEASEIDGCNRFQQLIHIKIPMLKNIISTVIVLAITGTLKVFDLPHVINDGGGAPDGQMFFLGTLMNFYSDQPALSSAFAVIMVIFGVVLSLITNLIFRQDENL